MLPFLLRSVNIFQVIDCFLCKGIAAKCVIDIGASRITVQDKYVVENPTVKPIRGNTSGWHKSDICKLFGFSKITFCVSPVGPTDKENQVEVCKKYCFRYITY
jgi:hypothetical protein